MMRILVCLGAVALLAGCSADSPNASDSGQTDAAGPSLFVQHIQPILTNTCATCHMTGQEAGELALIPGKSIESLVGVPSIEAPELMRVNPGDPDSSYLVMKLEGTHVANGGSGSQMPFGAAPLTAEEIRFVRQWISEGAKP